MGNAPESWKLDDGSAPPAKKPFDNPTFDAATRTFRGTILWEVLFHGDARWEYEMVFAEDFGSIVGGHMSAFGPNGSATQGSRFVDPSGRTHFRRPDDLMYVQKPAALSANR